MTPDLVIKSRSGRLAFWTHTKFIARTLPVPRVTCEQIFLRLVVALERGVARVILGLADASRLAAVGRLHAGVAYHMVPRCS